MKAVKFVNFTDTPFTWSFDGVPHTFNPNEPIYLEAYKAEHFGKHLVNRELDKMKLSTGPSELRKNLERKCLVEAEPVSPEVALDLNAKKEEESKKKGKKKVEKEFVDLNSEIE